MCGPIATTCAACRTTSQPTPSPATNQCRRSTSRWTRFRPFRPAYGIIFDNHGVPIWWYQGPAWATRVLPNGNVLWFDFSPAIGRSTASMEPWSAPSIPLAPPADPHDLRLLGNGNYLVGSEFPLARRHERLRRLQRSTVINAELQEVSPDGQLVWDWQSQDHIASAETGRWWPWAIDNGARGYDIAHWNSVEPVGGPLIVSFTPWTRSQDRQEHRQDRLEAGWHDHAQEPRGVAGPRRTPSAASTTPACSPTGP